MFLMRSYRMRGQRLRSLCQQELVMAKLENILWSKIRYTSWSLLPGLKHCPCPSIIKDLRRRTQEYAATLYQPRITFFHRGPGRKAISIADRDNLAMPHLSDISPVPVNIRAQMVSSVMLRIANLPSSNPCATMSI